MNAEFFDQLEEAEKREMPFVVATIISVKGSAPRKEGAKMIIFPDGNSMGTIGGGCGEAQVRQSALGCLDDSEPKLVTVNLTNDFAADEGMVCGGLMDVFLEPVGK